MLLLVIGADAGMSRGDHRSLRQSRATAQRRTVAGIMRTLVPPVAVSSRTALRFICSLAFRRISGVHAGA